MLYSVGMQGVVKLRREWRSVDVAVDAPRKNDPKGVRARILDAAADLFQAHGYYASSIHDVMQASQVSGGALHHHFPSKKALGLAVILERVAPIVRETWIDPLRTTASLPRVIAGVFAGIVAGIEGRGRAAGCPLNNLALEMALKDPEFRDAVEAVFAEWRAVLAERIATSEGGAALDGPRRAAAALFIISAYSGAMAQAKSSQSAMPLRSAAEELLFWIREHRFGPAAQEAD
jgi:TetR/AcrR family transcriptional repressor of nem operon